VGPGHVAAHGHDGHGLEPAADADIGHARHDPHALEADAFETGGAEPVHRGAAGVIRELAHLGDDAADVETLLGLGEGAADEDVFHVLLLNALGPVHEPVDGRLEEILGPSICESSLAPSATGSPD